MRRGAVWVWLAVGGVIGAWAALMAIQFYEQEVLPQPEDLRFERHYWTVGPNATTVVTVQLRNTGDETLDVRVTVEPYFFTDLWLSPASETSTLAVPPRSEASVPVLLRMDRAAPLTGGSAKILLEWAERGEPWRAGAHATVSVAGGLPPLEGERFAKHALIGAAVGGLAALLLRLEWRWVAGALLAPLYSRIARSEALEHARRQLIVHTVEEDPGIHFAELRRRTRMPNGALYHHLRILDEKGILESRREHGRRAFRLAGAAPPPIPEATPAERRILDLLPPDGLTAADLSARLGITRQGVYYHAQQLVERGLLRREPEGNGWRYYRP